MIKVYKYRIRPTEEQQQMLQQFFGASRYISMLLLKLK